MDHRLQPMAKTYELATFLGETGPVELVSELESMTVDENRITLHCATTRFEPQVHNYYGTNVETCFKPGTPGQAVTVRLDFCTADTIRLRYFPGPEVPDVQTPMVVGQFDGPVEVEVLEDDQTVTLQTSALRVVVVKEPWQLKIYDHHHNLIWCTRPVDIEPLRRPEEQWNPAQQRWIFYHRYAYPLGIARRSDRQQVFASFDLHYNEHIYGFGESYGPLDKRGTQQTLWLQESFSNTSPAAYKQVPFYMSTAGYGLYVNTSNALRFNVGNLDHTALSVIVDDTALLDFYLIYGPSLKEILPRYTAITGTPGVPPKWSFGLWMGRISYNQQAQVEAVAKQLRAHRIPCDIVHIDTGWFAQDWGCDLRFGPENFPDPAAMTSKLREQGFRVCLWQWPNMIVDTPMFREGRENGYLATRANGQVYLYPGFMADAGFIDYSNAEAIAWVQNKFRELFELGVSVIKVDFGEGAPPDAVYHSVASESIHNLYPLLYNKAIFEVTEEFWGEGQAMVWARSAWAGSQRYPIHWSGDGVARYEDLPCVLRSTMSFGLSGFPFYSHDIGGFTGLPSPDLYVRWAQLGLLSSHVRAHGTPPREPWAYGEEAETIFRRYDELRYRLMPYIYSEAVECGRTSLPMVRPLIIDYQNDPTTHTLEDEYLFGRNLLVAPIMDETNRRQVYLPPGVWVDYWHKELVQGGCWVEVEAGLEMVPLYVRAGAILPYGPLMQYVDQQPCDPLTVEIYAPTEQETYTVYDQSGLETRIEYRREGDTLTVNVGAAPGQVEVILFGVSIIAARRDDMQLEIESFQHGTRVRFAGTRPCTVALQIAEQR